MNTHAEKKQDNKSQSVANALSQKRSGGKSTFQFVDNRPEAIAQRQLQEMANNSPRAMQLKAMQAMEDNYPAQQKQPIQKQENNTGLPDNLKSGIENLSGYSMDDVKVHYNSDKPAQLHAHAYAQGADIHLGSGQEKHLPHETWHVIQQKQGRVKPTMQVKGKVNVNDDAKLEKEADIMCDKAFQPQGHKLNTQLKKTSAPKRENNENGISNNTPIQRQSFDKFVDSLIPQAYYYIGIDGKDVIAQYLGSDEATGTLCYWFNNLGRGDKTSWIFEQPMGQDEFYLLGENKEEIIPLETPQQYLMNLEFREVDVDWKTQLGGKHGKHDDWAFEQVNNSSIKWHPVNGWTQVDKHNSNISLLPTIEIDQIVKIRLHLLARIQFASFLGQTKKKDFNLRKTPPQL